MTLLLGSDEQCLLLRHPIVKLEIERKFSKSRPKSGKFGRFWRSGNQVYKKLRFSLQRARPCIAYVVRAILRESRLSGVTSRSVGEK